MKKIAALALCLLLLVSFTGCKQLDARKASSCYWEDATHMYITHRGARYKLVSVLTPAKDLRLDETLHCGDPGEPLLLLEILGDNMCTSRGKAAGDEAPALVYSREQFGGVYCREDLLEGMTEHLLNLRVEAYYEYVWEKDENGSWSSVEKYLDEADKAVMDRVLAGKARDTGTGYYICSIKGTDSEHLLKIPYDVFTFGSGYCVRTQDGLLYPVGAADRVAFETLLSHIEDKNIDYPEEVSEPAATEL